MSQNARVLPNLSIEKEVCMLRGAGDWGIENPKRSASCPLLANQSLALVTRPLAGEKGC